MTSCLFCDVTQRTLVVCYREKLLLRWLTLEDGNDRLSRNVGNYQSTLRKILEERRSHFHCVGILKSRTPYELCMKRDV